MQALERALLLRPFRQAGLHPDVLINRANQVIAGKSRTISGGGSGESPDYQAERFKTRSVVINSAALNTAVSDDTVTPHQELSYRVQQSPLDEIVLGELADFGDFYLLVLGDAHVDQGNGLSLEQVGIVKKQVETVVFDAAPHQKAPKEIRVLPEAIVFSRTPVTATTR